MAMLAIFATACNERVEFSNENPVRPESDCLVIRAEQPAASRTAMEDVGDGSVGSGATIRWADNDRIVVWAESTADGTYPIDGVTFALATYNAEYTSADFMATVGGMAEGTYTYTALYPVPASRSGSTVSYTLPAVQSGAYDPTLDVMTAATTGNALEPSDGFHTEIGWEQPTLAFGHLFHLLRIRIPEGKNNLGLPIRRLEITFPQEVVGTVSFDAFDPEHTQSWSNLSNQITVELSDDHRFDAGEGYVWLHIRPTTLDGEITFQAYDEAGVPADAISTTVQKTLQPQRITPIALTIPTSPLEPLTYVKISEIGNNLGEDWQTMTLSGYNFLVPFTTSTVTTKQYTPTADKNYYAVICADPNSLAGKTLPLQYESVHTLFDDPLTFGAAVQSKAYNTFNKVVPYLLEEDFTDAPASSNNDTYEPKSQANQNTDGVTLGGTLSGWNASRYQVFADRYVRIGVRYQSGAGVVGRYCGRLDTPQLSKLKANANADIRVSFDMGCYVPNQAYYLYIVMTRYWDPSDNKDVSCVAGTHTNADNPLDGQNQNDVADQYTNFYTSALMSDETNDTGSFTENAFPHKNTTFTATGAGNTTRVCWWALTNYNESHIGKNSHYYIYLDNIKVQIAN